MSEAVDTAKDFDETRKTFFALVGQCITMYQQVEDYLLEVFLAALGGEPARATAIFDTVRGLDGRLGDRAVGDLECPGRLLLARVLATLRRDEAVERVVAVEARRGDRRRATEDRRRIGVVVGFDDVRRFVGPSPGPLVQMSQVPSTLSATIVMPPPPVSVVVAGLRDHSSAPKFRVRAGTASTTIVVLWSHRERVL